MAWKVTVDLGPDGKWNSTGRKQTKEPWTVVYSTLQGLDIQAKLGSDIGPTKGKRLRTYNRFTITVEKV